MKTLALALAVIAPNAAGPPELHLICSGVSTTSDGETTSFSGSADYGTVPFSGSSTRTVRNDTPDRAELEIAGTEGRMKLPYALVPLFHKRKWIGLKKIEVTARTIKAQAVISLRSPRIEIDRITGAISIWTMIGNYIGQCEAFDPATAPQKF